MQDVCKKSASRDFEISEDGYYYRLFSLFHVIALSESPAND